MYYLVDGEVSIEMKTRVEVYKGPQFLNREAFFGRKPAEGEAIAQTECLLRWISTEVIDWYALEIERLKIG